MKLIFALVVAVVAAILVSQALTAAASTFARAASSIEEAR